MPALKWLSRAQVKSLVTTALESVGDPANGVDIEAITFADWSSHHRRIFAITLVDLLMRRGYDVFLTEQKFDRFANVGALIDFVADQQTIRMGKLRDAF